MVGTLSYVPERLRGAGSAAAEISCLALLYEMLAGRRAFQGESNLDTMDALKRAEPRPLQEFLTNVPDDLDRIIKRCLRKQPEERYGSISEIERELEDCALSSGVSSGANLRALFLQSKRPRVAISLSVVLLTVASLCFWWLQRSSRVRWVGDQVTANIAANRERKIEGSLCFGGPGRTVYPYQPAARKIMAFDLLV